MTELVARRALKRGGDRLRFGRDVDHVGGALAALLTAADIHGRDRDRSRLHDSAGAVAHDGGDVMQQPPVHRGLEVHDEAGVGSVGAEGFSRTANRAVVGVGVGYAEDHRSGLRLESRKERLGFGGRIGIERDGVMGDE